MHCAYRGLFRIQLEAQNSLANPSTTIGTPIRLSRYGLFVVAHRHLEAYYKPIEYSNPYIGSTNIYAA